MPAINVNIQPEVIHWALSQTQESKLGDKLMKNIKHWLDGTKTPTFNQIEDFSKKSNIPLGYFFLQKPPKEYIPLLEYRTVDSIQSANPSRNLIDTIHEMEAVQDWMISYRKDMGFDVLPIVGSMKGSTDITAIVDKIRADLELDKAWFEKCNNIPNAFNYMRGLLEENGIVVMMNGVVNKNTHRALNVEEFRAFTLVNEWAPLIFINAADSQGARLFSLFHEIVHIWLGEDDLYNDVRNSPDSMKQIEFICNAVAGELMVPQKIFLYKWNQTAAEDLFQRIKTISKYFLCSEIVIARKALDNKKITKSAYDQIVENALNAYKAAKENKESGGNYYNTMTSRLDRCFIRALCESINMGRTSYTEAYRLTNTSRKTFSEVADRLGGAEW